MPGTWMVTRHAGANAANNRRPVALNAVQIVDKRVSRRCALPSGLMLAKIQ